MTTAENDREKFVSVAASFRDEAALEKLGSSVTELSCPECCAKGARYGRPNERFELEGFTALSKGGLAGIHVRCHACNAEVTLPHR